MPRQYQKKHFHIYLRNYTKLTRGRIFSRAENELGARLFLNGNEFLNDFSLHLVSSWEQARSQTD